MRLKLRTSKGTRFVGSVDEDTFFTSRTVHGFMKKFKGFGISKIVLDELEKENVIYIYITYKRTHPKKPIVYVTTLKKFLESDKTYLQTYDGHEDLQHFVSVDDMQSHNKG